MAISSGQESTGSAPTGRNVEPPPFHHTIYALASSKKIKLLEQLLNHPKEKESNLSLKLIEKNNKEDVLKDKFKELLDSTKRSFEGNVLGYPLNDDLIGSFAPSWIKELSGSFKTHAKQIAEEDSEKTKTEEQDTVKKEEGGAEKPEATPKNGIEKVKKEEKEEASLRRVMDISSGVYSLLSKKDDIELDILKKSSHLSTRVMKYACVKRMEDIIDDDMKVTHRELSAEIETKVRDPSKVRSKLSPDYCETIFSPTVQSGAKYGRYDFKVGVKLESDKENLSFDNIIFSVGVRYKDYSSYIARTFLVGPSKAHERIYNLLVKVYNELIQSLVVGKTISEVISLARSIITKEDSGLLEYFTSICGWETGLIFMNKKYVLKQNNSHRIEAGMTFCVRIGFLNVPLSPADQDKKDDEKKVFSCLLADTVVVTKEGTQLLTKFNYKYPDIMYEIADEEEEEDDEEEEEEAENEQKGKHKRKGSRKNKDDEVFIVGTNKTQRSLRSSRKTLEQLEKEKSSTNLEKEIMSLQRKLMVEKARRERRKIDESNDADDNDEPKAEVVKKFASTAKYHRQLKRNQVFCDPENECVFVPIFGYHVPFRISSIKSVSKSEEEHATLLRLNFFYPTGSSGFSRDISTEMKAVLEQYPKLAYVKEMSFKSRDHHNLNHQLRLIKELQKRVRARQKKKEQEADLVVQADLVLNQTSRRPRLSDISMKPPLRKGKCVGSISAHTNGFRFRTNRGEVFDLIYSNVKHFIFQPCDHELIVLIHFHLKNPVMIGQKTKTRDVQFYTEVVEGSTALDSHRRTMYDPDEIDEEYRERQLRKRLNQAFKNFCDQVISAVEKGNMNIGQNNEYDMPYRSLGFSAVPHKEMVLMQPTVHCLVNLTETPFFVVSLDDIEHIHFERTDFRVSRTFDMVFILKKYMQLDCTDVPQRLQSIPVDKFEIIKQWIHEKGDITFTCGTTPLNWKNVMIGVREEIEFKVFWDEWDLNGEKKPIGWNFLSLNDTPESGAEEEEEVEEGDSVYEVDDEGEESSDDEWSDEEEGSSDSDHGSAEEGETWEELDRKAAESDRQKEKRERDNDVDDNKRGMKKRRR